MLHTCTLTLFSLKLTLCTSMYLACILKVAVRVLTCKLFWLICVILRVMAVVYISWSCKSGGDLALNTIVNKLLESQFLVIN